MQINRKKTFSLAVPLFALAFTASAFAQHRGDNLAFQGLDFANRNGVKATAMGGAFTAASGELESVFWNPAGLVGISGIQFTANFNSSENLWRERQDYRPNRQVVTLAFILDGLYTPNPEFNGVIDNDAFFDDSTYIVNDPVLGQDNYSEEAADWQKELDQSGFSNFALAAPFKLGKKDFVASVGYNRQIVVSNYDRNQTHTVPHLAWDGYGDLPSRVVGAGDTVRVTWSDFERQRTGPLSSFTAAVAAAPMKRLQVGLSMNRLSGTTQDFQALNRVGYFDLFDGIQIYSFTYDTLNARTSGESEFSATEINLGFLFKFDKLSIGASLKPGYTINRNWSYSTTTADANSNSTQQSSGEDKLDVPFSFSAGLHLQPHENFGIALDLERRPYGSADFSFRTNDETHRDWVDQTSFRAGVEFRPFSRLALLGGYRSIPQVFIPDGAADLEKGPVSNAYTFGLSLFALFGRFDFAYEIQRLKYYDVYFSNTNWAFERLEYLRAGYTFML